MTRQGEQLDAAVEVLIGDAWLGHEGELTRRDLRDMAAALIKAGWRAPGEQDTEVERLRAELNQWRDATGDQSPATAWATSAELQRSMEGLAGQRDRAEAEVERLRAEVDKWISISSQAEYDHAELIRDHDDDDKELADLRARLAHAGTDALVSLADEMDAPGWEHVDDWGVPAIYSNAIRSRAAALAPTDTSDRSE